MYYYFINRSSHYNFINNKNNFDISKYLDVDYSQLVFNNYDEYKDYFYKTDHHWNYKGSYKGYTDIIKLLLNEEGLKPTEEVTFNIYYYGSAARSSTFTKFKELFTVYKFNIQNHDEYINGNIGKYGNKDNYSKNEYMKDFWANRYAEYYGNDYGEIIYDFKESNKENLLILSNSFSNSVNELIASHFDKTYVVDLRYYKDTYGYDFDYKSYIKNNNIDKVLVICDINYLISDEFDLKEVS